MGDYCVVDGDRELLRVTTKDDEQKMIASVSKADDEDWALDAANDFMDGHDTSLSQITRYFGRGAEYMTAEDYRERTSRRVEPRGEEVAEGEVEKDAEVELSADGEIAKVDKKQQIVFGWAYVTHDTEGRVNVDKSGDFIDEVEEIEKSAYDYVLSSRKGDADHTNVQSGRLVESIVFTPDKIEKMGLPSGSIPLGWWLGYKVDDPEVWKRVEKGELRAFSIHGKGTRKSVD